MSIHPMTKVTGVLDIIHKKNTVLPQKISRKTAQKKNAHSVPSLPFSEKNLKHLCRLLSFVFSF